ncbi:DUF5691 domain-containing protein [Thalassoglobus polymorphus]|uniref:Uncharacterized protein n=1 Tax=Thalassoglobus polymorphus TaxID=2527994 RepID=A0A517QMX6_9PLAN|nr:DUF5691 domain-containing protein [Thalassoglobus polymorphus]QDT32999.1 hypothetical protein Mal48_22510 [Thalassoglobus polymorphus]
MNELFKAALVGTRKLPVVPLDDSFPTDQIATSHEALSPESDLLLRIGRRSIYELAGQPTVHVAPFPAAPSVESKIWSKRFLQVMHAALGQSQSNVLIEFLRALDEQGLNIPDSILPDLFNTSEPELRQAVRPVIDERGVWLAKLNPEWEWVLDAEINEAVDVRILEEQWNEGTIPQRCEVLTQVRLLDAEQGRTWLLNCFKKEKADVRRQFLERMATSLSEHDEEFLESALKDRSKYVKQVAADLLAKIPTSNLSARHQQRATQLLERIPSTGSQLKLTCQPPQELPRDWEEDGIPASASGAQGKRAFWTEELVSRIPPANWTTFFEASPLELINAVLHDDFSHSVITGWTRSVGACDASNLETIDWVEPLWKYWSAMTQHPHAVVQDQAIAMLETLSVWFEQSKLERAILQLVQDQPDPTNAPISRLLPFIGTPWSSSFAKEYLRITRGLVGSRTDRSVIHWLNSLPAAATAIPKEAFEIAQAPWRIRDQAIQSWQVCEIERLISQFAERIQLRAAFYEELESLQSDTNQ